ncbi:unnamed protein product [Periconia digitata]|uniref:Uncharacterized protein n=1 Tax=Periconia digitata TaxID=1303443 RepID=A0A9W4XMW3_9PLEO|nr:unnamed protein product [Periconia digitata]
MNPNLTTYELHLFQCYYYLGIYCAHPHIAYSSLRRRLRRSSDCYSAIRDDNVFVNIHKSSLVDDLDSTNDTFDKGCGPIRYLTPRNYRS